MKLYHITFNGQKMAEVCEFSSGHTCVSWVGADTAMEHYAKREHLDRCMKRFPKGYQMEAMNDD